MGLKRLFLKTHSPYYYLRKAFYILGHLGEYLRRRKVYFRLKESGEYEATVVSSMERRGWSVVPYSGALLNEVTNYCAELGAKAGVPEKIEAVTPGKYFWNLLITPENIREHPQVFSLASDPYFKNLATMYLGEEAVLSNITLMHSYPLDLPPTHSQLWHVDADDTRILTFFLYCNDVDEETGPFTLVSKDAITNTWMPRWLRRYGYNDEKFKAKFKPREIKQIVGPKGMLFVADPVAIYHYGSRCTSKPRLALSFRYSTFSGLFPVTEVRPGAAAA